MTRKDIKFRLITIEKQIHELIWKLQEEDFSDKEFETEFKEITGDVDCLNSFFQMDKINAERAEKYKQYEIYNRAAGQER